MKPLSAYGTYAGAALL